MTERQQVGAGRERGRGQDRERERMQKTVPLTAQSGRGGRSGFKAAAGV